MGRTVLKAAVCLMAVYFAFCYVSGEGCSNLCLSLSRKYSFISCLLFTRRASSTSTFEAYCVPRIRETPDGSFIWPKSVITPSPRGGTTATAISGLTDRSRSRPTARDREEQGERSMSAAAAAAAAASPHSHSRSASNASSAEPSNQREPQPQPQEDSVADSDDADLATSSPPPRNLDSLSEYSDSPQNMNLLSKYSDAPQNLTSLSEYSDSPQNLKSLSVYSDSPQNLKSLSEYSDSPQNLKSLSEYSDIPHNLKSLSEYSDTPQKRSSLSESSSAVQTPATGTTPIPHKRNSFSNSNSHASSSGNDAISLSPKRNGAANASLGISDAAPTNRRCSRSELSYSMASSSSRSRSHVLARRPSFADEIHLNFDGHSPQMRSAAPPPENSRSSSSSVCSCSSSARLRKLMRKSAVELATSNSIVQENSKSGNAPASSHDPAGEFSGADRGCPSTRSRNSLVNVGLRISNALGALAPPPILSERQTSSRLERDGSLSLSIDEHAALMVPNMPPSRKNSLSASRSLGRFDSLRNMRLRANSLRPMQVALLALVRDLGFPEDASRHALSATSVDIEAAVDLLLDDQWRSLFRQSKEREDAVDEKMRHEEKANEDSISLEDVILGEDVDECGDGLAAVVLDVLPKRKGDDTSAAKEDVGEREKSRGSMSSAHGPSKAKETGEATTTGDRGEGGAAKDEKKEGDGVPAYRHSRTSIARLLLARQNLLAQEAANRVERTDSAASSKQLNYVDEDEPAATATGTGTGALVGPRKSTDSTVNGEDLFCLICMEFLPRSAFVNERVHRLCTCAFCVDCLREHYSVKIRDGNVLDLKCFGEDCGRDISKQEIAGFVGDDEELMAKYEKFRYRQELSKNPNCRWCPAPGCEQHIIGSPDEPHLICPKCATEVCFECNSLWHPGKRCEDVVDSEFAKWTKKVGHVKKCPSCRAPIEKSGGCNAMVCYNCKTEFCWLCMNVIDNSAHFTAGNFLGCPGGLFAESERTTSRRIFSFMCLILCLPWVCCEACICVTCCHE